MEIACELFKTVVAKKSFAHSEELSEGTPDIFCAAPVLNNIGHMRTQRSMANETCDGLEIRSKI